MGGISGVITGPQMLTSSSEILKNFTIYEKRFSSGSEITQKLCFENILLQRYGQSIYEQNIDQQFTEEPQKLKGIDKILQLAGFTSSNLDYIILDCWAFIWR